VDDLAARLGINRSTLYRYMQGQGEPKASDLFMMARRFGWNLNEAFADRVAEGAAEYVSDGQDDDLTAVVLGELRPEGYVGYSEPGRVYFVDIVPFVPDTEPSVFVVNEGAMMWFLRPPAEDRVESREWGGFRVLIEPKDGVRRFGRVVVLGDYTGLDDGGRQARELRGDELVVGVVVARLECDF
jgi:transcriptional regulator with XRE-family HTH domain